MTLSPDQNKLIAKALGLEYDGEYINIPLNNQGLFECLELASFASWRGFKIIMENGLKMSNLWSEFLEWDFNNKNQTFWISEDDWSIRISWIGPVFAEQLVKFLEVK